MSCRRGGIGRRRGKKWDVADMGGRRGGTAPARGGERGEESGRSRWCLALFNYHLSDIRFPEPFRIRRQISPKPHLPPPLASRAGGRNLSLLAQPAREPPPFTRPSVQRALLKPEHCGSRFLKLCIFKMLSYTPKRCIFFYCIFLHLKTYLWRVYMYSDVYSVVIPCIVV